MISQAGCSWFNRQRYDHFTTRTPLEEQNVLVIGILGGNERWDDDSRGIRQLALKLEAMGLTDVEVETLENRKLDLAMELIHGAFDRNLDNHLDYYERSSAQLILFGHSLGGSAVIKLSRRLKEMDMPVLLTVQVDSVGFKDHVVPSNVLRAANLFQQNGWILKGEEKIDAEDPRSTNIIANIEFDYSEKEVDMSGVPWERSLFSVPHSKMDADPEVWAMVEEMIINEIMLAKKADNKTNYQVAENLSTPCDNDKLC
jgi:hypothetical protein